jgi:hypothetical protein
MLSSVPIRRRDPARLSGVRLVTAICPSGGASGPKTGAAAIVDYSAGLLGAIFAAYDIAWLIPVIPLVGLGPLVLTTFCASDPPSVPTFTSAETNALLSLSYGADFTSGLSKLRDWCLNAIWYDACQCTVGTATTLVPPAAPAGTPIIQYPGATATTACAYFEQTRTSIANTAPILGSFPAWGTSVTWGNVAPNFQNVPYGSQWSVLEISYQNIIRTGAGQTWRVQIGQTPQTNNGSASTDPHFIDRSFAPGTTNHITMYYDPAAPNIRGAWGTSGTGTSDLLVKATLYCTGGAGGVTEPCCPPDPVAAAYLENILSMVTLVQRQIAPFAYVSGSVHAGLSGRGQFAVHGLLGLAVAITTVPARLGRVIGDPDSVYDAGWINVGTADGWGPRQFISSNPFVLKPISGDTTLVGYSIPSDVTVTITELVREP